MSGRTRVELLQRLSAIAEDLEEGLTQIIINARDAAAELAYDQVVIEAQTEDLELEDDPEDEARASAATKAFIAAFLLALLAGGKRDVRRAIAAQDYRLKRIAATEVWQAYSQAALRLYPSIDSDTFLKRWDATLDKKTCPRCRAHDGETVALDEEFVNSEAPGDIHPNCRCVVTLVKHGSN